MALTTLFYIAGTMADLGSSSRRQNSIGLGVNDSGQAVGEADLSSGGYHAFLYSQDRMTDLGTLPGDFSSSAAAINAGGQVVGESSSSTGISHAFLEQTGP